MSKNLKELLEDREVLQNRLSGQLRRAEDCKSEIRRLDRRIQALCPHETVSIQVSDEKDEDGTPVWRHTVHTCHVCGKVAHKSVEAIHGK